MIFAAASLKWMGKFRFFLSTSDIDGLNIFSKNQIQRGFVMCRAVYEMNKEFSTFLLLTRPAIIISHFQWAGLVVGPHGH